MTGVAQDFRLCFAEANSPRVQETARLAEWDWLVSNPGQNADWYSTIIGNLHQDYSNLHAATMNEIRDAVTLGLMRKAFDRLKALMQTSRDELVSVVRIPARTLARREVFQPDESERILRVAAAFQRALEVFEDLDKARRWFSTPKRALGEKTPMHFCDTEVGAEEVMRLLGRIEHGVFT